MKFGIPDAFLSDQGKNYQSNLIAQLWELLDVKQKKTTAYHPECDGLSERLNRSVKKMIKCYINESHTDWDEHLDEMAFAYNTARHATTKYSPFFLMFGRHPKVPAEVFIKNPKIILPLNPTEYVGQMDKCLRTAYFCVKRNTEIKMLYNKEYHDRKNIAAEYKVGDRVWVRELKTPKGLCRKFNSKWKGPYTVEAVVNEIDYRVKPDNRGKRLIVHRNNLKTCMEPISNYTTRPSSQASPTVPSRRKMDKRDFFLIKTKKGKPGKVSTGKNGVDTGTTKLPKRKRGRPTKPKTKNDSPANLIPAVKNKRGRPSKKSLKNKAGKIPSRIPTLPNTPRIRPIRACTVKKINI